jgi:hypothetical protein
METRNRTKFAVVIAALALAFGSAAPANAVMLDPDLGGKGFITRGNVISHPDLGKAALVVNPTVTFTPNGARYEQTCSLIDTPETTAVFTSTLGLMSVDTTARVNKGKKAKITKFFLTGTMAPIVVPTTLCPVDYVAAGDVTFVPGEMMPTLTFATTTLSGSWMWNPTTLTWDVVVK